MQGSWSDPGLVLAAGAAAGLSTPAAVALAVGVGSVLGAVLALRTARWISGPLQEVGGALFTSLSGHDTQHLEERPGDTGNPEEDTRRLEGPLGDTRPLEGRLRDATRLEGRPRDTRRLEGRLGPVLDDRAPVEVRRLALLCCAHPPVMREEPNSNKGRTNRKPISHLRLSFIPSGYPRWQAKPFQCNPQLAVAL